MGWWSTDILGGDTPLDFEDEFYHIIGKNKFTDDNKIVELNKEDINENLNKIIKYLNKEDYEIEIGWQVLAVIILKTGANMSKSTREKLIWSCDEDGWSKENDERFLTIENLKKNIIKYKPSEPIEIKSKGLFEIITEKLINKNEN